MTRRRRDKRIWYIGLMVFVAVFLFTFLVQREDKAEVDAASLQDFDPGYIISDYQMGNYQSMTEVEIQAFLTKKNKCANTDKGLYDSLTARYSTIHWHFKDGHFVCLSEEVFGDGVSYGEDLASGGETAAHIIWQAAQDYKINPQVLIVLLEKEQSLITDPYPHSGQYRSATGYGCPDTAPCAEQYYGFKNQVRKAAALFRTVLDGGWTNYPLGNNYIQYNPSASCGGSVVNVKNLATSALYRYTPYQPNAAALAAGYGTAECGAYGNRNFYLYFQDWFGGVKDEKPLKQYEQIDEKFEGSYNIISALDDKVALDVYGAAKENGINVQVWVANKTKAQVWRLDRNDDGTYTIVNPNSGKVLDVYGAQKVNGANVNIWEKNNTCAQKWKVIKDGDYYTFVSACSDKVLDVKSARKADGTNVQIWEANETKAQKWKLVEIKN